MSDDTLLPAPAPEPPEGEDVWKVRLSSFEGPLDLLLHLVRVNEVDVTDIPIVEIARQYDEYLAMMRELNLEIAGEYLVMAATLVHIKSRLLLPADPVQEGEAPPEDPRTELVRQLQEHERFKQAAENLHALDSVRSLIWTREGPPPEEFAGEELLQVDLFDLLSAFRRLLGRMDEEARLRFGREDVSVADKIVWIGDLLDARGHLGLHELLDQLHTMLERIAVFLAILEMARLQMIVAFQTRPLGEIRIARRTEPAPVVDEEPVAGKEGGTSA